MKLIVLDTSTHPEDSVSLQFKIGKELIGEIHYNHRNPTRLWSFKILENYRGLGYAHEIFKLIKEHLKGHQLWLWVYKTNTVAIKVYKKAGFEIVQNERTDESLTYEMICNNL